MNGEAVIILISFVYHMTCTPNVKKVLALEIMSCHRNSPAKGSSVAEINPYDCPGSLLFNQRFFNKNRTVTTYYGLK